jgi:REP element-mobilizing transposase RayT
MVRFRSLHRHSIRLPGFDYGRPGWYFVTIVCHRTLLAAGGYRRGGSRGPLGTVRSSGCRLQPLGDMVAEEWMRLEERFPWVELGESIVMPDHFHGLVYLTGDDAGVPAGSLSKAIQAFKSTTTWRAKQDLSSDPVRRRGARLWQRNYYESVIRDPRHLAAVRNYIVRNPARMPGMDRGSSGMDRDGNVRDGSGR